MKKTMIRLSVALLALLLALPMAVACQTKTNEGASDEATTPVDTTPATPWKDVLLERASEYNEDYTTLRLMTIDGALFFVFLFGEIFNLLPNCISIKVKSDHG